MISLGLDGFVELHGDRYFGDDAAVVGGIGWKDGRPVTVIAIERGTTTKDACVATLVWHIPRATARHVA